jgi:exodeoxyribonuclease V alpha subunit
MTYGRHPILLPTGTARDTLVPARPAAQQLRDLARANDLDEGSTFLAWQLAELADGLASDERDVFTLIVGRLLVAQAAGSTCAPTTASERGLLAKVSELVGGSASSAPLILDGDQLYTQRTHACEVRVVRALAKRLRQPSPFATESAARAVHDVAAASTPVPSADQVAATMAALAHPLGIISGGPGTGKTTTALVVVRALIRLGIPATHIALAAPTGKAASRLEEELRLRLSALTSPSTEDRALLADGPKAQTLHRLLGVTAEPGSLLRSHAEPLALRAVLVDESSMIDLVLMDRLLAALADDCSLVLLGDADQLPAVSAGAVFRDLDAFGARLGQGFRANPARPEGKRIADLASAVRAGDALACVDLCTERREPDELRHAGVEIVLAQQRDELLYRFDQRNFRAPAFVALTEHVFRLDDGAFAANDLPRLDALAAHLARARILAVTRQRNTGAERCNAFLHDLRGGGAAFLPGEPVLMLRNDRERELWNGDHGVAVRVRRPEQGTAIAVAFRARQGWIALDPGILGNALGLAYALTVHKSQGSEFDEILLLLPDSPSPLLTRQLVYTAVSRARTSVVLCGSAETLAAGVDTPENRKSGVAERLAAAMNAGS